MLGLKYIRNTFGLTMKELAEKLNVSANTINLWEKGTMDITEERLIQLENFFKIPKEYFQKELKEEDKLNILESKIDDDIERVAKNKQKIALTYIREIFNMSMNDLAVKLGITKQSISKWENGIIEITSERLIQLEKLFGIPANLFIQESISDQDKLMIQKIKLEKEFINYKLSTDETFSNASLNKPETVKQAIKYIADLNNTTIDNLLYNLGYVKIENEIVQGIIKENEELKDKLRKIRELTT